MLSKASIAHWAGARTAPNLSAQPGSVTACSGQPASELQRAPLPLVRALEPLGAALHGAACAAQSRRSVPAQNCADLRSSSCSSSRHPVHPVAAMTLPSATVQSAPAGGAPPPTQASKTSSAACVTVPPCAEGRPHIAAVRESSIATVPHSARMRRFCVTRGAPGPGHSRARSIL